MNIVSESAFNDQNRKAQEKQFSKQFMPPCLNYINFLLHENRNQVRCINSTLRCSAKKPTAFLLGNFAPSRSCFKLCAVHKYDKLRLLGIVQRCAKFQTSTFVELFLVIDLILPRLSLFW
jgi:hypothetical protein